MMTRPLVVLTGAGSAIAAELYRRWEERGWTVVALSRRRPPHLPAAVRWLQADLAREAETVRDLGRALAAEGPVRGFVHLAGTLYADRALATTGDEWRRTLAVNLSAAFFLAQALAPRMGPGAAIVFVSSVDARLSARPGPAAAYGASKAGLEGLVPHLAQEWGPHGIRVNAVAPGALETGLGPEGPVAAAVAADVALGRLGRPAEVAAAIDFLLGDEASYITGQVLRVDGGLNLGYGGP
ncbi:NAD(P)-dependent oxidoreductase [Candidatus Hydrogenisulfobacillus filiaventi]|uniref:NAD(P)-dependent oxidoreductase n=1 Tax=Candidatus Hydrogenisulfobacillus filiaventi TaxID=2707344 RepID=A0A6F8ZJ16_9FIRM|nr:SDR family NAD(P)-dependent oxidoreductase [Bacillota bacterium]CAB1129654.1 NAD(P)-dependent oxidoreductase [Candidatus Hydrogenisulfobacillus filiaventi]